MYFISIIIAIYNHTKETVEKYKFKIDLKTFNKNLIDLIKLTFDSKVYHRSIVDVIESEIIRQMDKSNTNHIGYFHQNIFQYIGNGWTVPKHGYDVINEKLKSIYLLSFRKYQGFDQFNV
ncbi:MAG: Eco47II family restriction endonuclease [Cyanobacterium sp.]